MLCSECNKNPAILFYKKIENGKESMEGYCYDCAKKKGINPNEVLYRQNEILSKDNVNLNDMTKQFETIFKDLAENINLEDIENIDGAITFENGNDENIVYNLGIPSETTTDLLKRIKNECESRKPNTIIISIGINDALYLKGIGKEQTDIITFESNIEEIINICKTYTKNICFIGLTRVNEKYTVPISWNNNEMYFNKNIEKYNEKIKECCIENKISFLNALDILEIEDLNKDGIHPNEMGHEKIFERIKEEI